MTDETEIDLGEFELINHGLKLANIRLTAISHMMREVGEDDVAHEIVTQNCRALDAGQAFIHNMDKELKAARAEIERLKAVVSKCDNALIYLDEDLAERSEDRSYKRKHLNTINAMVHKHGWDCISEIRAVINQSKEG